MPGSAPSHACARCRPTHAGHLLSAPDGRDDHWAWPLPQALRALQQRFPSSGGHSLLCGSGGVSVVQLSPDGQPVASSSSITAEQIASGEWQAAVAALQLCPAPRPAAAGAAGAAGQQSGGPGTPSSSTPGGAPRQQAAAAGVNCAALPADIRAAAERAAAIVSEFERVFGSAELLQAVGKRQTAGTEVSWQLFRGAAAAIRGYYGLPRPRASSGVGSWHALQLLADELVQRLLPVLARAPQGLPDELTPDVPAAPQPASIIAHCRRFGATDGCLARFAAGVSGGQRPSPHPQPAALHLGPWWLGLRNIPMLIYSCSARPVRGRHHSRALLREPQQGRLPLPALRTAGTRAGKQGAEPGVAGLAAACQLASLQPLVLSCCSFSDPFFLPALHGCLYSCECRW